ncbi:MAG: SIR2 family NAD-dependent protein deacylase [Candidatus Thorarchaeota archaeon]|jgi:NAD-dependent deacetylase
MVSREDLDQAIDLISNSKNIVALTGAGISVDSGIPDFRSEGGLWERYDPHEYATYDSFLRNPSKFWMMGQELAEVILKAEPNPAHKGLAKLEKSGKLKGIITMNIDNLHQAAGSKKVIELRGNYLRAYCMDCAIEYIGDDIHRRVVEGEIPPKCDKCNGVLKSEAVLFGEPLPEEPMAQAVEMCRSADLMLVVGTSMTVYPVAFLPQLAKDRGGKVVVVNLTGTNRDNVADLILQGRSSDIIPKITTI